MDPKFKVLAFPPVCFSQVQAYSDQSVWKIRAACGFVFLIITIIALAVIAITRESFLAEDVSRGVAVDIGHLYQQYCIGCLISGQR